MNSKEDYSLQCNFLKLIFTQLVGEQDYQNSKLEQSIPRIGLKKYITYKDKGTKTLILTIVNNVVIENKQSIS